MPATGWASAATSSTGTSRSCTTGSLVNSRPSKGETAARASPVTMPLSQPQRSIRSVTARVPGASPAPR